MASLSQRDAKTRNEAGVPLIFLESVWICKVWIGFPGVFRMEILIYLAFLYTIFHLFIKTISGKMSNL